MHLWSARRSVSVVSRTHVYLVLESGIDSMSLHTLGMPWTWRQETSPKHWNVYILVCTTSCPRRQESSSAPLLDPQISQIQQFRLEHGSLPRGPPGCITRPTATFAYSVCNSVNSVFTCTSYCYCLTCGPRTSPQYWAWPFAIKRL